MWRILVSSLLVAAAAGQNSGFSNALNIAGGYLPPISPDNITPNVVRCEKPKTFFRTETTKVTKYVSKTVLVTVPQVIRKTSIVRRVVPTTITITDIKQVRSPVVRNQVETKIVNRVVTKTITGPGRIREVLKTVVKSQIIQKTVQRIVSKTQVISTTQLKLTTDVKRVTEIIRQTVPQVVLVTVTEKVPGRVVVLTESKRIQVTSVVKYQPPAKTVVENEVKYIQSVVVRRIPGPVISEPNIVHRTKYVQQTIVKKVPQPFTKIIEQDKVIVRTVTDSKIVSRTEVKHITKVQKVPVVVTITQDRIVTVPLKVTKTVVVVRSVPGPNVVRKAVVTDIQVKSVRGPDRIVTDYRNVERVFTSIINKTVIKPSVVTDVISRTERCSSGYKYAAPSNPLVF